MAESRRVRVFLNGEWFATVQAESAELALEQTNVLGVAAFGDQVIVYVDDFFWDVRPSGGAPRLEPIAADDPRVRGLYGKAVRAERGA